LPQEVLGYAVGLLLHRRVIPQYRQPPMGLLLNGGQPLDQFGPADFAALESVPPVEGPVAREFQHGALGCRLSTAFQHGLEMSSKVRMAKLTSSAEQLFVWLPSIAVKDAGEVHSQ